ncbi:MAG: DUF4190 domain-containing protein [Clostridiales bacterium]|nr:DUF4190 domain-containing protein [Clostridiales bacterium]
MKYCGHCGSELLDEAVVCPKCGCWTNDNPATTVTQKLKTNVCALIGFILSLVSLVIFVNFFGMASIAGLVCSIVGLKEVKSIKGQRGKEFAITGIVIGACTSLFGFFYWMTLIP